MTEIVYNRSGIPFDIDSIATDLNGKADVDLTNVNSSGTSRASGWALPSTNSVSLTLGASGTTYTAPANGWVSIQLSEPFYIGAISGVSLTPAFLTGLSEPCGFLPLLKGQQFIIYYSNTPIVRTFLFHYTQGEV